ncbi:MAG: DUF1552 domain-containing protein [Myxococcales bacterium]|nr:MAG: DUF1552 domain-containing protein [Myxococcales bacterium]
MEILNKLRMSRRFALRGMLGGIGVSMWLPVLDAMCDDSGTAFASGEALPTSFGTFFWGNGIHPNVWTPKTTGVGDAWQLPPSLQDFADLKADMTFVTGLDMLDAKFKGHGWGVVYVMAGGDGTMCSFTSDIDKTPSHKYETAEATQYQKTIDQLIADDISAKEMSLPENQRHTFKSLETGVLPYTGMNMGTVSKYLSHRGPNDFLPPERDPKKLFDKLFAVAPGTPTTPGAPTDISNKLRRSVLDAVLEDANRLKTTVGENDAKRIDAHMESIRTLELQIPTGTPTGDGATPSDCTIAAPPMTLADMTAKSQAINRLVAQALACNLTRVYSHLWSGARDDNAYPTIPVNSDHHGLTHGDASMNETSTKIERYIMSQYADMCRVMKQTTVGAGNLLDNTLIYGISDVAEPSGHVMSNWHIVLMGHAGGKLPGNRHFRAPGRKVTELMLTMQQVMGLSIDTFGSWDRTNKTISEILSAT